MSSMRSTNTLLSRESARLSSSNESKRFALAHLQLRQTTELELGDSKARRGSSASLFVSCSSLPARPSSSNSAAMARLRPPSLSPSLLPLSLLLLLALPALSQSTYPTWCGKYYLPGAPTTLPSSSSRFPTPSLSPTPLLDFRCAPSVRPFVIGDSGSVLLDLGVGNEVGVPWEGGTEDLEVELWIGEERVGGGSVGVNSTGVEMGIELGGLEERRESYELRCVASSGGERFERRERLWYLPLNEEGSTTKMNARTGGILVPVEGGWEPLFPLGFYSTFQGYLDTNLSALDEMAANGCASSLREVESGS